MAPDRIEKWEGRDFSEHESLRDKDVPSRPVADPDPPTRDELGGFDG